MKKIHAKTREEIEKKGKQTTQRVNKKHKEMLFQPGDMVWVHFRKDRFPNLRKSKLMPRGAGPYKVLAKSMTMRTRLIFLLMNSVLAIPFMLLI